MFCELRCVSALCNMDTASNHPLCDANKTTYLQSYTVLFSLRTSEVDFVVAYILYWMSSRVLIKF